MMNWQIGYAVFSVSQSKAKIIENYINNQEEHHKKQLFKGEFIELLLKNKIQERKECYQ